MNKRLLFPVLLLSPLFVLSACSGVEESSSSNEDNANSSSSTSSIENTIVDAYEGDSRPNFGEDFDYDSDYTPQEPDDPNYIVSVSLDENSPILFQNGTRTMQVKPNYLFKEEDFDLTNVSSDRTLAGMALYLGEDKEYKGNFTFGELRAPKQAAILRPFFNAKTGYTALDVGSGANSKFNFDKVPGTITENRTIVYNSGVLVDGGENGYTESGVSFVETSRVDINSALRLDSKASIDEEAVYEFVYNFQNLGEYPLYLDGYQISASAEYKSKYDYESRYRMDIDLQPGESISFTAQYLLGKNGNALTYFVADKTMVHGFSLGMSMAFKKTDLTAVDSKYVSQPETATTGKVKLQLPEGITVSGYNENQTAGQAIAIPEDDKITNTTGKTIAGWYIVGDPIRAVSGVVVSDIEEYTIAPYFAPEAGTALVPGTNSRGSLPDYSGSTLEDGTLSTEGEMNFKQHDAIVEGLLGKNFSSDYEFAKGDYFRLLTGSSVTAGSLYKFHFTLKNNGSNALSLKVYQVQGAVKISEDDGAVSTSQTIAANATVAFDIEIRIQNKNSNVMTIFMLDAASKGLNLDIAMAQEKVEEVITSKLSIAGGSGITFEDGSTSVSLQSGASLPAIKNETGRELAGFYDEDGSKYAADSFVMPEQDITLRPYFNARDGYTRLWAMNGQSGGVAQTYKNSDTGIDNLKDTFDKTANGTGYTATYDSYKTIVKDENGLDEEGVLVKNSKALVVKDAFRINTIASSSGSAVVTLNKKHSYVYIFENRGTSAINFDVYAINSGTNTASGTDNHFELSLAIGETKTYEINPTFTAGSANKNTLTYFVAKEGMDALNFAVSMSAKFAS